MYMYTWRSNSICILPPKYIHTHNTHTMSNQFTTPLPTPRDEALKMCIRTYVHRPIQYQTSLQHLTMSRNERSHGACAYICTYTICIYTYAQYICTYTICTHTYVQYTYRHTHASETGNMRFRVHAYVAICLPMHASTYVHTYTCTCQIQTADNVRVDVCMHM